MFKLLIADDEPRIRRGLAKNIAWNAIGFSTVKTVSNGKEALEIAEKILPHLIIIDIRMPELDGLEVIGKLREENIHSQVIIISGYDDFTYAQQAIRYGVCDYILKPINEADLYDRVLNVMDKLELAAVYTKEKKEEKTEESYKNYIIKEAMNYIDLHFREDINLAMVADNIGVHPNYLSALFTKICGKSFVKYLTGKRIEEAKKLMDGHTLKIYEISEMVGYSDYRWFSKVFKKWEGITPKKYME